VPKRRGNTPPREKKKKKVGRGTLAPDLDKSGEVGRRRGGVLTEKSRGGRHIDNS